MQKPINNASELPLTKQEIVSLYKEDKVRGFHIHRCKQCHTPTDFERWINTTKPYQLKYVASYEPYVMIKRLGTSRYDARFRGYGWNKIVHILQLAWVQRVRWVVAPELFIFHIPHQSSRDSNDYFKGKRSQRWNWITGLSKLTLRDIKKRTDTVGFVTS